MKKYVWALMLFFVCKDAIGQTNSIDERLVQLDKQNNSAKAQADTIVQLYGDMLKEINPVAAAYLHDFKGYEGRWSDISLDANSRGKSWQQQILNAIKKLDRTTLSKEDALHLYLIENSANQSIQQFNYKLHLMPIAPFNGIHLLYANTITRIPMYSQKDVENAFKLMVGVDESIEQVLTLLQEGIRQGVLPAKIAVAPVVDQLQGMLTTSVEKSPFYINFTNLQITSDSTLNRSLQQRAKSIIKKEINPAYQKLLTYIQNVYYPKCRDNVSLSSRPQGKEIYRFLVRSFTTTNLTPEQIHRLGLSEVKRILADMAILREKAGFKGSEKEFNDYLRTDPQFYYNSATDLLQGYRDICKRIDPELTKLFGKLPRLPYGIKPVPDYSAPSMPTAYYASGSYQLGRPGYFFANTYDLKSRPKWEMEALSLHEAVPGHHLQRALESESTRPDFLKFLPFTAYTEGWGLYTESLGEQMGLYQDNYSKYGQLTYEMWRAIRLVVDTGIHYYGWSREDAIKYFTANSAKAAKDIQVEVDRYIAWPGQAVSYKIGQIKILELKQAAQKAFGTNFNIRDFHDVVLGSGSIPLTSLEENVNSWIAANR